MVDSLAVNGSIVIDIVGGIFVFTVCFLFGIVGLAPQASYAFSTAKKSNQKRPPLFVCPAGT